MPLLCIPAGCQILRTEHRFWHPAGVRLLAVPEPGVSLRSTPGYLLASLQDVSGRLLRLSSIPLETARNLFKTPSEPGRTALSSGEIKPLVRGAYHCAKVGGVGRAKGPFLYQPGPTAQAPCPAPSRAEGPLQRAFVPGIGSGLQPCDFHVVLFLGRWPRLA